MRLLTLSLFLKILPKLNYFNIFFFLANDAFTKNFFSRLRYAFIVKIKNDSKI